MPIMVKVFFKMLFQKELDVQVEECMYNKQSLVSLQHMATRRPNMIQGKHRLACKSSVDFKMVINRGSYREDLNDFVDFPRNRTGRNQL